MAHYSIKELETLSGIKAHTLRIWEKRHSILHPRRTDTNIRFYNDDDLRHIINVSLLNNSGLKISHIARMSPAEIHEKVLEISRNQSEADVHIDGLLVSMLDLNEEKFEQGLARLVIRFGFERTVVEIVYPFLERIGVLWQTGNITPAQEHFVSNLIRQKLIVAIDGLQIPTQGNSALLFLPEHEAHELGLLFYHYLVRKKGIRTYYLGQMVPRADLISVYLTYRPDILITSLTTQLPNGTAQEYVDSLRRDFPKSTLVVGGAKAQEVNAERSVRIVRKALDVNELL